MSDLVKGLREAASGKGGLDYGDLWAYCDEAADEIERLEAELAEVRARDERCHNSVVETCIKYPNVGDYIAQLEAELAEARRERDALREAAKAVLDPWNAGRAVPQPIADGLMRLSAALKGTK